VTEYVSLDGVMQDPVGSEGSGLGAWTSPFRRGPEGDAAMHEHLFASDALLFGRTTYEGFATAWPSVTDTTGFANRMNTLTKFVVSTTLTQATWTPATIISRNVVDEITKLKALPSKDILIYGSRTLVLTLMEHALVDVFHLLVYPTVLGRGERLFADVRQTRVELTEAKTVGTGIMLLTYQLSS
jgi:dihydrofolate reductase